MLPGSSGQHLAWGAKKSFSAAAAPPVSAAQARGALLNCSAGRCHKQAGTWQTYRFPGAYRAATSAQLPGYFNM